MAMLVDQEGARREIPEICLVGRLVTCHLWLEHPSISGTHAVIQHEAGQWTIRDLGSRNGSKVDGIRLEPTMRKVLAPGSVIRFGLADPWTLVLSRRPPAAIDQAARTTELLAPANAPSCQLRLNVSLDGRRIDVEIGENGEFRPLALSPSATFLLASLEQAARHDQTGSIPPSEGGWLAIGSLGRIAGVSEATVFSWSRELIEALASSGFDGALDLYQTRERGRWLRLATGCAERIQLRGVRARLPSF